MRPPLQTPFILHYQGIAPTFAGPIRHAGTGSAVLGRVTMGSGATLGDYATLRADGHVVVVGDDFWMGPRGTVHIAHEVYGTTLGARVSVGANAIVHACTVGDDCVIEEDVAVLDGAVVGPGCVVARGSVVYPRSELPAGHLCEGLPARPVRPLTPAEREAAHARVRAAALSLPPETPHPDCATDPLAGELGYVAATVTGAGTIRLSPGSSLWFGCAVEATAHPLVIGAHANVQDNSILRAVARPLEIGADCTVGHNVRLEDCTVGARALVGMLSDVAPGTVIGEDVLLAAGSTTEPGQVLEAGWLWAGRPAKPVARIDDRKRTMMHHAFTVYCEYARDFARAQAAALRPLGGPAR